MCVQLLQTLNILFENIRNETSLCESITSMMNLARIGATITKFKFRASLACDDESTTYTVLIDFPIHNYPK